MANGLSSHSDAALGRPISGAEPSSPHSLTVAVSLAPQPSVDKATPPSEVLQLENLPILAGPTYAPIPPPAPEVKQKSPKKKKRPPRYKYVCV